MKKIFIIFCVLVLSCAAFGQQIKKQNVELNDVVTLLGLAGYELFSYDITEMLNERYDMVFVRKEFDAGKEIANLNLSTIPNKRLLTDLPESYWQQMIDAGQIIDSKTQAIAHAEKITIGFHPHNNDSTKFIRISVPGFVTGMGVSLKMRGLPVKDSAQKVYRYHVLPFKIGTFKEGEFIPLILFGSSWYDEQYNAYRFCGEREIDPDMSSEILKDVPHHYVFGVRFVKKQ